MNETDLEMVCPWPGIRGSTGSGVHGGGSDGGSHGGGGLQIFSIDKSRIMICT